MQGLWRHLAPKARASVCAHSKTLRGVGVGAGRLIQNSFSRFRCELSLTMFGIPKASVIMDMPAKVSSDAVPKALSDMHYIVILGGSGHGKSHTGNTLCRMNAFETSNELASKTKKVTESGPFEFGGARFNVLDTPGFFDTAMDLDEIQKRLVVIGNYASHGISAIVIVTNGRATAQNQKVLNYVSQQFGADAFKKYGILLFTQSDKEAHELHHEIQSLPGDNEYKKLALSLPKERLFSLPSASKSGWFSRWKSVIRKEEEQRKQILNTVLEIYRQATSTGQGRLDCEDFRLRRIKADEQILLESFRAERKADLLAKLQFRKSKNAETWAGTVFRNVEINLLEDLRKDLE